MTGHAINVAAVQAQVRSARAIVAAPDDRTRSALLGACDVLLTHGDFNDKNRARELQKEVLQIDETLAHLGRGAWAEAPVPFEWVPEDYRLPNRGSGLRFLIVLGIAVGILIASLAWVAADEPALPGSAPAIEPASEPFLFIRKKDHRYV